jgi:putative ABC transport system permease protein
MEFGPIWRAALRNKTGAVLIILEIAFTLALVLNAVAIAQERARQMGRPSGVDEANIFHFRSSAFDPSFDSRVAIEEDLRQIRGLPGVHAAVQINAVPLGQSGWGMGLKTEPRAELEGFGGAVYFVDDHVLDALGVELIAGEPFAESDIGWRPQGANAWPDKVILSRGYAEALFPDDPSYGVGKTVYIAETQPMTVVGVVARLQSPWPGWTEAVERSMLVPQHLLGNSTLYLIRTEAGDRDALMPVVESKLIERDRRRVIQQLSTMEQTRERSYELNKALINILTFTIALLIAITTLGVAGLTSFNVNRRTKQIGTRRALGATRRDVLRYFLAENLLFTAIGVTLGALLAVGLNVWLVEAYSIPRFAWYLVPTAMFALIAIGQLAVLLPARRASRVAPAVATRTV